MVLSSLACFARQWSYWITKGDGRTHQTKRAAPTEQPPCSFATRVGLVTDLLFTLTVGKVLTLILIAQYELDNEVLKDWRLCYIAKKIRFFGKY